MPKAIFYLLKEDYRHAVSNFGRQVSSKEGALGDFGDMEGLHEIPQGLRMGEFEQLPHVFI